MLNKIEMGCIERIAKTSGSLTECSSGGGIF